jgi:hypothetical protein
MSVVISLGFVKVVGAQDAGFEADLFTIDDGIYVESFRTIDKECRAQTKDNAIFKPSSHRRYGYCIERTKDFCEKFMYVEPKGTSIFALRDAWKFYGDSIPDQNVVEFLDISVSPDQCLFGSDYPQTIIRYTYRNAALDSIGSETTGLIENTRNLWIHPPRSQAFLILETAPFPYVSHPVEIGKEYHWSLNIDPIWASKKHMIWNYPLDNQCSYYVNSFSLRETHLGQILCYEIQATCNNRLGQSLLTMWYHPIYGFVKLDFDNLNNTRITLDLIAVWEE